MMFRGSAPFEATWEETWHRDAAMLVDHVVPRKLRALDEVENDGVLLPNQGLPDRGEEGRKTKRVWSGG